METALTGPSIIIAIVIIIISDNVNITSFLLETIVNPVRVFSEQTIFPMHSRTMLWAGLASTS